jgi:hypothetical protein
MRAKVILFAAVAAVAVLAPAVYLRFKPDAPAPAPASVAPTVAADEKAAPADGVPHILRRITQDHSQEGLPERPAETGVVDHQTYVIQRRAELSDLGMHNDPESLKSILSEMENPDAEVRKAALTASVDFGSKDAIPALQNELNWATDPQEKVEIQKAIDFLELPTLGSDDIGSVTQSSDGSAPATN